MLFIPTPSDPSYFLGSDNVSSLVKYPDGAYKLNDAIYGSANTFNAAGKVTSAMVLVNNVNVTYRFAYDANGNLFSVTDPLGTTTTLSGLGYNSLNPMTGSLGTDWSHGYEIALEDQGNGSILYRNLQSSRLYKQAGSGYLSEAGEYSTLVKNADGTFTITEQSGQQQIFDQSGRIISRKDRNGITMTFAYTGGKLSSVIDGSGRTTNFAYDANNMLIAITDPKGNAYSFSYTGGNLATVTNPDGGQWSYGYDDAGYLTKKTDPGGNVVTYAYDSLHRIISSTDPSGSTRDLDLPSASTDAVKSTTYKEKDGGEWRYTYDTTKGTKTGMTDPLGNTTTYTYDANRNMLTKTEPVVGTTRYTYDGNSNMLSTTDPLGNVTSYTYNSLGQVLTTTGPQGTTTNSYDTNGNLLTSTDPAGATTTYTYDTNGNMTKVTNALNQAMTMTYTAAGLLVSTIDPTGAVTSYTYDANGNIVTSTDPAGKVTTNTYDGMNRLATVTDTLGNVTAYGYDKLGNRISVTDANGAATTYTYNYLGQVTAVTDALSNVTTYGYSGAGGGGGCPSCGGGVDKLTSLADAKGQTTGYHYDLLGRLTQEADPLQKNTTYGYDAAGNMTLRTDANGAAVAYSYDALKRLTKKTYPGGSSMSYTYDTSGRVLTAANANVAYTYAYDAAGRVTKVTDSRGYALSYTYDLAGNRTGTTLQPGTLDPRVTSYAYDTGNRPQTITSPAGAFSYGYDTRSRRTSLAYPNQVTATYGYDDSGRLTGLRHAAGATTIAFANYSGIDKVGNRMNKTTQSGTENYLYDPLYRLLQAATPRGTESYSYDAVGNRLTGPGAKDTAYLYNAGNQMTEGRQFSYIYDNNGNQATRSIPAVTNKGWLLTWDYENRLTKLEKSKGTTEKETISFTYDPQGRRIGKQYTIMKNGVTKTSNWSYVYDNDNIAMEAYTDVAGAVTKTFYTQGAGTDEHLALERGGQYYYYHADGLGSVVAMTDTNRAVVQTYGYDSFGMVKPSASFLNSYTYTGREWDKETGLLYYRKRYRDPIDGNFIQKDPIGFAGGDVNLYAYVQNNPINWTDPTGLTPGTGNVPPLPSPPIPPSSPGSNNVDYPYNPPSKDCKCSKPVFHQDVYWNCVYNNVLNDHLDDYLLAAGAMLVPSGATNVAGAVGAIGLSNYIGYVCRQKATYCD